MKDKSTTAEPNDRAKKDSSDVYRRLAERYENGDVPWDNPLPPPEVIEFTNSLAPGRALDLGCGYGRASIYLASLGWEVEAVDFIEKAVKEARKRAEAAGVSIRFHLASVLELAFLKGPFDFALDVGCGHALPVSDLKRYQSHLFRLLRPGGTFMLYARMAGEENEEANGPPGLDEDMLLSIFEDQFRLTWSEHSITSMADGSSWPSAWFRFEKRLRRAESG